MNWQIRNASSSEKLLSLREVLDSPQEQIRKVRGSDQITCVEIVANVMGDPSPEADQLFEDCLNMPVRVAASAIVQAWGSIPPSRKARYMSWLSSLDSDRAGGHRIALAGGLVRIDPVTAANQLLEISSKNKEHVARLADVLLNQPTSDLDAFVPDDAPEYRARKIIETLLQIAENERTQPRKRYDVLRWAFELLQRRGIQRDTLNSSIFDITSRMLQGFPSGLATQFRDQLANSDRTLLIRFFPSEATAVTSIDGSSTAVASAPRPTLTPTQLPTAGPTGKESSANALDDAELGSRNTELSSPLGRPPIFGLLENGLAYLRDLEGERHSSREAKEALNRLSSENTTLKAESAGLKAEIDALKEGRDTMARQLRGEQARATSAEQRAAELAARSSEVERAAAARNEELQRRIQANAIAQVDEVKNDIRFAVTRIIRDVPNKRASVDVETGRRVLIRLHEVLDELERRGIRIRTEA